MVRLLTNVYSLTWSGDLIREGGEK